MWTVGQTHRGPAAAAVTGREEKGQGQGRHASDPDCSEAPTSMLQDLTAVACLPLAVRDGCCLGACLEHFSVDSRLHSPPECSSSSELLSGVTSHSAGLNATKQELLDKPLTKATSTHNTSDEEILKLPFKQNTEKYLVRDLFCKPIAP